ncbi:hypothetical protein MBLNU230_g0064t1 [Neophaeotheca triangularis]
MSFPLSLQLPILALLFYLITAWLSHSFPTLQGKRILLLIAHPDDEAMFFAPALQNLANPALGNQILILCLSSGDADGLGHVRKSELTKSALALGVTNSQHVVVVEDATHFPDSMTKHWEAKRIASVLTGYFAPDVKATASTTAPPVSLDAIVTFDAHGVSGHPNHISLYHGAREFLRQLMQRHAGWECPIKLYTLTTTNVVRKYSSFVDAAVTVLSSVLRLKERGAFPTPLLVVSGPGDVRRAQRAMTTAHKSQMRWFRWGWIGISRYMVVNDLRREKVV